MQVHGIKWVFVNPRVAASHWLVGRLSSSLHPSVDRLSVSLAHKQQAGQLSPLDSPTCSNTNVIPPCKMALAGRFCFGAGRLSVTRQQLLVLGSR